MTWKLGTAVFAALLFVSIVTSRGGAVDEAPPSGPKGNVDEFLEELSEEAEETIAPVDEHEAERNAATFPCNIFSQGYLAKLMGAEMDGGTYSLVSRTEDSHAWKSDACVWQSTGGGSGKADLWISQAKHFDSGKVACYPPLDGAEPFSGLGTKAWWRFQKSWGIGTIRACSASALAEAEVARPGADEAAVRQSARLIVQRALEAAGRSAQP